MSSTPSETFVREPFLRVDDPRQTHARSMLRLLLAQDGSTTRLCEAVAGGPVELRVLRQQSSQDVPAVVRRHLSGSRFIERITLLAAHGQVLMDNLSYVALQGLEGHIERDLIEGRTPIGHLLSRWWTRREPLDPIDELSARLWGTVGTPDASATRCYRIVSPEGPRMLITETYRRGLWMLD